MTVTERPEVRRYCDDLLLALRMRDVPGRRIGEVLTEVRAHLAESGEAPEEAFGTVEDYAAALAPDGPSEPLRSRVADALRTAAIFLGLWWALEGATSLATGADAQLGPVPVAAAAVAAMGVPWLLERIASPAHGLALAVDVGKPLLAATAVGVAVALTGEWLAVGVPAALPLVLGLGLVLAGGLLHPIAADPVVDPLEEPGDAAARGRRDTAVVNLVLWGSLALMASAAVLLAVVLDRMA